MYVHAEFTRAVACPTARPPHNKERKKDQRNMSKEEEHEIKEKYRPRSDEDA